MARALESIAELKRLPAYLINIIFDLADYHGPQWVAWFEMGLLG